MYRVADARGISVRELRALDGDELAYWIAYYKLRGFPDDRQEHLLAQIAYVLAMIHSSKGHKPKLEDFKLDDILAETEQDDKAAAKAMISYIEKLGGGRDGGT